MELPKVSKAATSAADSGSALRKLLVQGVFHFTGVFSTCVAQFVFYRGAVDHWQLLAQLSSAKRRSSRTPSRPARRCATNWLAHDVYLLHLSCSNMVVCVGVRVRRTKKMVSSLHKKV
ncbi:hypothetical protein PR002_g20141 [Phytophthora rubi]|uniref:Uncharacterized protein n=1 Tax=Phytophthora rubi TaxID=129364 RepID=A0A6A3JHY9_9STRA|nr:hypothetical protein PR002_g20141 [Phytophthora rubi]